MGGLAGGHAALPQRRQLVYFLVVHHVVTAPPVIVVGVGPRLVPAAVSGVNGCFAEMGRIAVDLGDDAKDVVQSGDPRKAAQLRHDDAAMDDLHRHLFSLLMDQQWKHGVVATVDVTLLGRYYERFADHAVEIGRRVIFQATGTITTST